MAAVVHVGDEMQWRGCSCTGKFDEPRYGAEDSEGVDRREKQEGLGPSGVEESFCNDAALCGRVEVAKPGIDEREQGGEKDVRCEDRLVDLVPERVAMLAL